MPGGSCAWWTAGSSTPEPFETEPMPRVNLPVIPETPRKGALSCLQCARCCTYLAVGINAPTSPRLATEILWHLYHQGVSVCRDEAGEWYVQIESRCKNLGPGNLCAVYEHRPHICRDYSDQACEVNAPQPGLIEFKEPEAFLEYLSRKKPKIYRAIEKKYVPGEHRPATVAPPAARGASRKARSAIR